MLVINNQGSTWRIEPKQIDSLLFGFCHSIKYRVRVSVEFRVKVRVGFRVRVRIGLRIRVGLVCNID